MAIETKIRKIGNSLGVILPKEALQALNVSEGTTLYLTKSPDGALRVSTSQPGFKEMMEIAEEGMRDYRNALRELAK